MPPRRGRCELNPAMNYDPLFDELSQMLCNVAPAKAIATRAIQALDGSTPTTTLCVLGAIAYWAECLPRAQAPSLELYDRMVHNALETIRLLSGFTPEES